MPTGDLNQQLNLIKDSPTLYIVNFYIALLISPFLVWMLLSFFNSLQQKHTTFIHNIALYFYIIYIIMISISYGSQVMYLPYMLNKTSVDVASKWYFYNDYSFAAYINQTGYFFWSIATLLLFNKVLKLKGIPLIAALLLYIISIGQIFASIGLYTHNAFLSSITFYCGILLLAVGVLCIIYSLKSRKIE
jgi:hypothetical protein